MHQVHGILVLAAFLAISSYASYKTLPWGVKELVRKPPLNNYGTPFSLESELKETWRRAIDPVLGSPPAPISRLDLYRSAWLAYKDVVTFQITSDRRVYVAPPARPQSIVDMSPWEKEYFHGRILASLLMMQLALRHMVVQEPSEPIPNVTLVNKYVDDCFRDFSVSSIIDWADYTAMSDSSHSSPWATWLHSNSSQTQSKMDPGPGAVPLTGFAPILFWSTSQTGMDSAAHCHGLSMPNYDWVFTDIVLDETGVWDDHVYTSTDERKDFEVVWKSRKNKLIWRGGFHGEARPLAHEFLGDRNLVPRARAAKASLQHSEIIDVKLVGNPEFDKLDARLYGDRVSYEEQLRGYNYALNIDGYGPSSRLRTQLAAGVLVFKVDSVMKAHYMEGMVPWVHYVPVSWGDLENDLIRKVKWASTHDEAAQRIALEGQRYARQYLTDASTAQYMSQVIRTFGDAETSDQPFELIPGSIPFCCQDLEAYNLAEYKPKHGMSGKEYFMKLCLDFTAGWAPPCPHITDDAESEKNPADVAIAV